MTPKKSPTNFDLAAEIREIKSMITPLISDVQILKEKEATREIAKSAVDEYKRQEEREFQSTMKNRISSAKEKEIKSRNDAWLRIAILITALTTLVVSVWQK